MRTTITLVLCVLALTACASVNQFAVSTPMVVPPEYEQWYSELEACSGLKGSFQELSFRTQDKIIVQGVHFSGYWDEKSNTILLRTRFKMFKRLVLHEMMHSLVGPGHPDKYFRGVCGDLTE
jgi:hypothetical protein